MATALVFNPGSNSLKFELIDCAVGQSVASLGKKLASASLDRVGKQAKLSMMQGREVAFEESVEAHSMGEAVCVALSWLRGQEKLRGTLESDAFGRVIAMESLLLRFGALLNIGELWALFFAVLIRAGVQDWMEDMTVQKVE